MRTSGTWRLSSSYEIPCETMHHVHHDRRATQHLLVVRIQEDVRSSNAWLKPLLKETRREHFVPLCINSDTSTFTIPRKRITKRHCSFVDRHQPCNKLDLSFDIVLGSMVYTRFRREKHYQSMPIIYNNLCVNLGEPSPQGSGTINVVLIFQSQRVNGPALCSSLNRLPCQILVLEQCAWKIENIPTGTQGELGHKPWVR